MTSCISPGHKLHVTGRLTLQHFVGVQGVGVGGGGVAAHLEAREMHPFGGRSGHAFRKAFPNNKCSVCPM